MKKYIISLFFFFLMISIAHATKQALGYPSGSPITVCVPSDSNTNCGGSSGGGQTPWTSAINGGGYSLSNVNEITATEFTDGTASLTGGNFLTTGTITAPVDIGSVSANGTLTLQGNSASTGNTAGDANLNFVVGNSGGTTAMTILNNGNLSIGDTTATAMFNVGTANQFQVTSTGVVTATSYADSSGTLSNANSVNYAVANNTNNGSLGGM